ncbi:holo-[acyl-carrier-protein] synthase [Clostridium puniceum]|uniref:Holo-[acyl-carrier-protein] synthase n=1 Tax=Clostridium puniceum TaxID=29367 RepID=A0A1S8TPW2_9CLOT|nr:holo-ACP synthase [Clostridium puniceum]OOM79788.1 holo-[acyl-carrier-protein] synthase [Clostridium puniceum]
MIIGIGTDIIEIKRIEKVINRTSSFIEKSFTYNEIEYFKSKGLKGNVVAGNFAAKEAISKALGTGFRGFGLKDIEVLRDELGKPIVKLSDKIYELLDVKEFNIHISISHSQENAIAYAVMEVI